jgi:hypothetical protein
LFLSEAMMPVTRLLIGLTTLAMVTVASAGEALACSCMASGPPCQNAFQVDGVFAGTVLSISALPDEGPPLRPGESRIPQTVRVEFADVMAFRGVQGPALSVLTAGSGPACGYTFKVGERYLVYASRNQKGTGFVTGICSRTRPLADAGDDLRFLQTLSATRDERARLFGTIRHWERNLATGEPHDHGPVQNVLISVRGLGTAFEGWTDAQGRYELTVPPGKYEVAALPPAGFSTRYLQQTIELRDSRACFVANFGVQFDGRIKGVVRQSSGEPAERVVVQLMAAESVGKTGNIETLRASSDAGGSFEFVEVPPGRYVVGVDLTRRMNPEVVYPVTFHPGTKDAALATVVQLDGGQQQELEPMTLPPARRSYRLTGTVVFEDGNPAPGAFISLSDGGARWRQVAVGIKPEADGTFSFVVHEGLSYIATASYWDATQRKQIGGTVGPFVVTGERVPLKVVLSGAR